MHSSAAYVYHQQRVVICYDDEWLSREVREERLYHDLCLNMMIAAVYASSMQTPRVKIRQPSLSVKCQLNRFHLRTILRHACFAAYRFLRMKTHCPLIKCDMSIWHKTVRDVENGPKSHVRSEDACQAER